MTTGLSLVQRLAETGALELAEATAAAHGLDLGGLLTPRRTAGPVAARRDLYRALRARGWSYPRIGWVVDKDHQTIMHALGATVAR